MRNIVWLLTVVSALILSGCADAGKDQKANVGDTVTLDGSASKGKYGFVIVKYQWKQIRGKHVKIENSNKSIAHFVAVNMGKKKRNKLVFELSTVEKAYWGQTIKFRDRVTIIVEKPTSNDTVPPVITLNGDANLTLNAGDTYTELGATAIDNKDGNVSVVIRGTVDTTKAGTYTITYSAKDRAGNEATATRTITVQKPILTSLTIESNTSTLHVGEQVSFDVTGTYSDGNTKKVDANITWIISPSDSLENNGTAFVAAKEGNVTVKAKINDVVSNALKLNITLVINGYTLPPEPDPAINNATLLGVDSNNNGIRDDVERWVIQKYANADYPKHKTELGLQWGKTAQQVIQNTETAYDDKKYLLIEKSGKCEYKTYKKLGKSSNYRIDNDIFDDTYVAKAFNTKERMKAYYLFNSNMGGHVFGDPYFEHPCDFDLNGLKE